MALTGTTTLTGTNGVTLTMTWALSPSQIIRPGDRVLYPVGVLTPEQSDAIGNGNYVTTFAFISTGC